MSELFTELSDQQQELVSGGIIHISNVNNTTYFSKTQLLGSAGLSFAGPLGSASSGHITGANQVIYTTSNSSQHGYVS